MQQAFPFAAAPGDLPEVRVEPIAIGEGRVLVGTCGFSYKDWLGTFYPPGTKSSDMLGYYAGRFPCVEIDSTYYRVPSAATFASLHARTPPDFRFSVKLPGSVTHLPSEDTGRVPDDALALRENLEPLVSGGKLAAALAQFPNSFEANKKTQAYLLALREALPDLPLVAEFRNRSWQQSQTLALLADLEIGWCNVDEPRFEKLLRPSSDVVGPLAYVRFHGRNAKQWWRGDATTRYDYLYSPDELQPWTERVAEMAGEAKQTLVFFNNHRLGKAPRNAEMFAAMLLDRLA